MGVPSVVPALSGAAELVEHEVLGLHYKAGDPQDLADQLLRFAIDPELRRRCGQAALDHSAAFDIREHARAMEDLYLEAADLHLAHRS